MTTAARAAPLLPIPAPAPALRQLAHTSTSLPPRHRHSMPEVEDFLELAIGY
eukprot:CAMPEP_0171104286 /NCGR_PEP_ID=MMETSP0766_2-20121228/60358_1 /TAXON_ID=439317 /ORGANISM="Gambierdiscus australes, Strain CAWD 149" /LENGTH=51 /DNA_ID=CAMNT_0011564889 /DNA_START=7 /DNA_END=160 /DNA_ORIENTATION=-